MDVSAKLSGSETSTTVQYDFGADLDSMVEKFGADVVYGKALGALVIDVQSLIRRHIKPTENAPAKTEAEIQTIIDEWIPGTGVTRRSPLDKAASLIASMTPEQKAKLLADLQASA